MYREEFINKISDYFKTKPVLKAYLFGSYARHEENSSSDIDLLIELDKSKPIGIEFIQMYVDLKKITGKEIDLLTMDSVSKYVLPFVLSERKLFYERKA
ncbi:MAG TPA: nucleotidyltransferase domain-containing protein [Bacteroidia bacterium]|nr:nucleotidyltransferase domain-containing protein [Bacteroidia bacterium]